MMWRFTMALKRMTRARFRGIKHCFRCCCGAGVEMAYEGEKAHRTIGRLYARQRQRRCTWGRSSRLALPAAKQPLNLLLKPVSRFGWRPYLNESLLPHRLQVGREVDNDPASSITRSRISKSISHSFIFISINNLWTGVLTCTHKPRSHASTLLTNHDVIRNPIARARTMRHTGTAGMYVPQAERLVTDFEL